MKFNNCSNIEIPTKKQRLSKRKQDCEIDIEKTANIPETFLKHVLSLGFKETDAAVLYKDKENWIGASQGTVKKPLLVLFCCKLWITILHSIVEAKIKCVNCGFETVPVYNCLVDHCKTVHDWQDIPCTVDDCKYIAYSLINFKKHKVRLHSKVNQNFLPREYACTWKHCHSSFSSPKDLRRHTNIHTNNVYKCTFCPFRTPLSHSLSIHYRIHYKVFEHKCDTCGKSFTSAGNLMLHTRTVHDALTVHCPVCQRIGSRNSIRCHINNKHGLLTKWNKDKKQFAIYEP